MRANAPPPLRGTVIRFLLYAAHEERCRRSGSHPQRDRCRCAPCLRGDRQCRNLDGARSPRRTLGCSCAASSTGRETPQPLVSLWTEPKLIQAAGCIEVFTLPFAANALDHPPRPSMAATRAATTWPQGRVGGLAQSALIISRLVRRLPSLAGAHQSVHHHRPLSDSRRRGPPALQRHLGRTAPASCAIGPE
jgi:hypothetical protein